MSANMTQIKLVAGMFLVAGVSVAGTSLYYSALNATDPVNDIRQGRTWATRCSETDHHEGAYQLHCRDITLSVPEKDYTRAVRAWELTGERRDSPEWTQ